MDLDGEALPEVIHLGIKDPDQRIEDLVCAGLGAIVTITGSGGAGVDLR